ncbi:hypothetical protein [Phyllobacterium endophyticum]|uniref:hypothetical protein n=1 Tax=Phyllobacterium endophyticum TaxID=1149773 RepID=UPI0011C8C374|nr:hypothetical protein [Phyllobacterium endophyticum]TXR46351.1 hypothetical protein FVA77_25510 [Phyllobacterium endophyticum]
MLELRTFALGNTDRLTRICGVHINFSNQALHYSGEAYGSRELRQPVSAWYDIRRDSTNGGSGAHRWDNPATWEPSDNPVVLIYNIIRGIYYGTEWVYGGQNLPAYRLPASN